MCCTGYQFRSGSLTCPETHTHTHHSHTTITRHPSALDLPLPLIYVHKSAVKPSLPLRGADPRAYDSHGPCLVRALHLPVPSIFLLLFGLVHRLQGRGHQRQQRDAGEAQPRAHTHDLVVGVRELFHGGPSVDRNEGLRRHP